MAEEHRFRTVVEAARGGGAVAQIPPDVTAALPELEEAFRKQPELRERFEALSFSRRRELADPVRGAKKPETRALRLEKALERLRELG